MSLSYYFGRLGRGVITIFLVVTFVFVILRVTGDPVMRLVGEDATPEEIEYYAERWGLDQPLYLQYLRYFGNILRGDLGRSFLTGEEATHVVLQRVPATLRLGIVSKIGRAHV